MSTNGSGVSNLNVNVIKQRIEQEILATNTRLTFKKEELAKLEGEKEKLRKAKEVDVAEIRSDERAILYKTLAERADNLEADIQDVERITLSTNHARTACHICVYVSKTKYHIFLLGPQVTCGTLVSQVVATLIPENPQLAPYSKYLKMRRQGMRGSEILKEMRADKVPLFAPLFAPSEYTLVCNQGRKPGLWDEVDLLSPDVRNVDAMAFLSSLSLDALRGFGANGETCQPLAPNAPIMLAPMYLVKRSNSVSDHDREEELKSFKSFVSSSQTRSLAQFDKDTGTTAASSATETSGFADQKQPLIGLSTALPEVNIMSDNDDPKRRDPRMSMETDRSENYNGSIIAGSVSVTRTENGMHSSTESGRPPKKRFFPCCRRIVEPAGPRLTGSNTSKHEQSQEASAFEAFATLILFGENASTVTSENASTGLNRLEAARLKRKLILGKAADLMDFAWLGRTSSSARLYCRHIGVALRLDGPPRDLWSAVFDKIAHGAGDRLSHSVDFDEFHMQYKTLRAWQFSSDEPGVTFGSRIDSLVDSIKTDLKGTYERINLHIPLSVWIRRCKALALIVVFVMLVIASLEDARSVVEVANSFPQMEFAPLQNFTDYYGTWQSVCLRLSRTDVADIVMRQVKVTSTVNARCPATVLYPPFSNSQEDFSYRSDLWLPYTASIMGAATALGRFSEYDANGYEWSFANATTRNVSSFGLDVSSRAVVLDFEVLNQALSVAAHGQYLAEFASSGLVMTRLSFSSARATTGLNGSENLFQVYTIVASAFLGFSLLLSLINFILFKRKFLSSEKFYLASLFTAIAFGTTLPLVWIDYTASLIATAVLSTAYALSVMLFASERSWSWVLSVFDRKRLRLFSLIFQYIVLVVCYAVAMEGWYNDRPDATYTYGETVQDASVVGIVSSYAFSIFPKERRAAGDFISIIFGILFLVLSMTLVFIFFAVVIVTFREAPDQPNWGLFNIRSRRIDQPKNN